MFNWLNRDKVNIAIGYETSSICVSFDYVYLTRYRVCGHGT